MTAHGQQLVASVDANPWKPQLDVQAPNDQRRFEASARLALLEDILADLFFDQSPADLSLLRALVVLSVLRLQKLICNTPSPTFGFGLTACDMSLLDRCMSEKLNIATLREAIALIRDLDLTSTQYGLPFADEVTWAICKLAGSIFRREMQ